MRFVPFGRWAAAALSSAALCAAALALAAPAGAQANGKGFLFGEPAGALSLRGGLAAASAGGDVLDEARTNLTLGRGDFAGGALAGEIALALRGTRFEVVFGTGLTASRAESEYRDWVDEGPTLSDDDDLPIVQTTSFYRVPITVGLKAYLSQRGTSIGRFAWVPNRFAPYVGAGAGLSWYRLRQEGDFVSFETGAIRTDVLETSGWGPMGYAGAGADLSLSPHVALTADARYQYGRATPGESYVGYDRVDLSGVLTTLGFNLRF
jgi:hypothetical protein